MPRKLRVEFPGAVYHVMNRGDRREAIVRDAKDRERCLETLAEACSKTGWQVHAFCLMPNHFHLVVETPQPNLVAGMKWFLGTYTGRFNRRHKLSGHLFGGRYKSLLVGGQGGYLRAVSEYVHLNPVRAKLLGAEEPLRAWPWSSFPEYLRPAAQRPAWLRVDRVLGECGIPKDSPAGRRAFEQLVEARRRQNMAEEWKPIWRGWCFGDDQFRRELLERVSAQAGRHHYGEELRESAELKAQRLVADELRQRGWEEGDLATRRKGDPAKVAMAQRLRRETTMTLAWVAQRLQMGAPAYLTHLLYWSRRAKGSAS